MLGPEKIDLPLIKDKSKDPPPERTGVSEEGTKAEEKEESAAMVAIVEGIQPLPKRVVKKVDANEFVDFADLLQDQFPSEELNLPPSQEGVVLVQSLDALKRKKKRVGDFPTWIEALLVYTAVKCRESAPEIARLMAYGVIMGQAARDHHTDRWLTFDRKFRELAGAKKEIKWNELNTGLWNRCFSGPGASRSLKVCTWCMASGHSSWECPSNGLRRSA